MLKRRYDVVPIAMTVLCGFSSGAVAAFGLPSCDETRRTGIHTIISNLNTVESWIENVPPEEVQYLQREYARVLSGATNSTLLERPSYYAWTLRNNFDLARDQFRLIANPTNLGDAFLIQMASGNLLHLSDAIVSFHDYVGYSSSAITVKQSRDGTEMLSMNLIIIGQYISCLAQDLDKH
jgi:hypothetical protein